MRRLAELLATTLAASAVLAAPAGADTLQLSDGMPWSDVGRIGDSPTVSGVDLPIVSPDGEWVVYNHDAEVDGAYELWKVEVSGGPPVRISGLLPSGQSVFAFRFTPDGQRVVYRAAQDDLEALELYSVPIAAPAGSWVKLNEPLSPGHGVIDFGIAPDSSRIAYGVFESGGSPEPRQLWVAELDGASRAQLLDLPPGRRFLLAPYPTADFSRLAYVADATVDERYEAWSVPTAGGSPQKLNGALVSGGDVHSVHVSSTSDLAVYVADQQTDGVNEVFVVPITGGPAAKVSPPLPAGRSAILAHFLPGGSRILYAVADAAGQIVFWAVESDGTGAVQLTPAMVAGGTVARFTMAEDGSRILYVADQQQDEVFELYSASTAGGPVVKLSGTLAAGGDVSTSPAPRITPDGQRVLFLADKLVDGRVELWSAPFDGSAPATRLNPAGRALASWEVLGFAPSAESSRVAYTYRSRDCGGCPWTVRLFSVPVAGGPRLRVDDSLGASANVFDFPVPSPVDPLATFYLADQDADEQFELYVGNLCLFCDGFESGDTSAWQP